MDETLQYFIFGMCLVCSASILICLHGKSDWRQSRQKADEEYWKFFMHMKEMDIDNDSAKASMSGIKTLDELIRVNKRLNAVLKSNP